MTKPIELTKVFENILSNKDQVLERLFNYLKIPSVSDNPDSLKKAANFIADELKKLPFDVRIVEGFGNPFVIGKSIFDPALKTVIFYGHYDVQPAADLSAWASSPFEPSIRDGRIFARGVGDNKGQHFAQIAAIQSFFLVHNKLPVNVIVLLEGEEEIGSPNVAQFLRSHANDLKADLVIIADGPIHESGRQSIDLGVRGIVCFELTAKGASSDLHSGHWGGVVENPNWVLVDLLSSIRGPDGRILIKGFYDNVASPTELERQAMSLLPCNESEIKQKLNIRDFANPTERPFFERTMFQPNINIVGFGKGDQKRGCIPAAASVFGELRLVENMTVEEAKTKITNHVKDFAPEVEIKFFGTMEPCKTPLNSPFVNQIRRAINLAQDEDPLLIPSMGASLPNYVFAKYLDIPVIGVPYANADQANHAPNENMQLDRFIKGMLTGAATVFCLGQNQKSR